MSGPQAERPAFALSIVIPVYRSGAILRPLLDDLAALQIGGGFEIVLVDDGSDDGTHAVCLLAQRELAVPITVVEHSRNFGEHNAVLTGLRHAQGLYVVTMDDDGQHAPADVLPLYDCARLGDRDVVYAQFEARRQAWWRNLGSRSANALANIVLEKPPHVYLSTFRCLSRAVVDTIVRDRSAFPYVDGLVAAVTNRIGTLDLEHRPRVAGRSGYTPGKLIRLWIDLASSFSLLPLRAGVALGILTSGLAFLARHLTGEMSPSVHALQTLATFVQFGLIGLVGELAGRALFISRGLARPIIRRVDLPVRLAFETPSVRG